MPPSSEKYISVDVICEEKIGTGGREKGEK
jgi:hypothetical protein